MQSTDQVKKRNSEKLDTEMNFRCNGVVKSNFRAACIANGIHPSKKARELMAEYINNYYKSSQKQQIEQ